MENHQIVVVAAHSPIKAKTDLAGKVVGAQDGSSAVDAVKKLSKDVGIPEKLEALKEEDLPFLAESAYADACRPGNPKDTSVADMTELFRKLM